MQNNGEKMQAPFEILIQGPSGNRFVRSLISADETASTTEQENPKARSTISVYQPDDKKHAEESPAQHAIHSEAKPEEHHHKTTTEQEATQTIEQQVSTTSEKAPLRKRDAMDTDALDETVAGDAAAIDENTSGSNARSQDAAATAVAADPTVGAIFPGLPLPIIPPILAGPLAALKLKALNIGVLKNNLKNKIGLAKIAKLVPLSAGLGIPLLGAPNPSVDPTNPASPADPTNPNNPFSQTNPILQGGKLSANLQKQIAKVAAQLGLAVNTRITKIIPNFFIT